MWHGVIRYTTTHSSEEHTFYTDPIPIIQTTAYVLWKLIAKMASSGYTIISASVIHESNLPHDWQKHNYTV